MKFLVKFSWRIQEKSFHPFSANCAIIYSKGQTGNKHIVTEYKGKEALFLAEQEFIFYTLHPRALVKDDFIGPVVLTGEKKFDLLEPKIYSNEINNKFEPIFYDENKNELYLTPIFIKPEYNNPKKQYVDR